MIGDSKQELKTGGSMAQSWPSRVFVSSLLEGSSSEKWPYREWILQPSDPSPLSPPIDGQPLLGRVVTTEHTPFYGSWTSEYRVSNQMPQVVPNLEEKISSAVRSSETTSLTFAETSWEERSLTDPWSIGQDYTDNEILDSDSEASILHSSIEDKELEIYLPRDLSPTPFELLYSTFPADSKGDADVCFRGNCANNAGAVDCDGLLLTSLQSNDQLSSQLNVVRDHAYTKSAIDKDKDRLGAGLRRSVAVDRATRHDPSCVTGNNLKGDTNKMNYRDTPSMQSVFQILPHISNSGCKQNLSADKGMVSKLPLTEDRDKKKLSGQREFSTAADTNGLVKTRRKSNPILSPKREMYSLPPCNAQFPPPGIKPSSPVHKQISQSNAKGDASVPFFTRGFDRLPSIQAVSFIRSGEADRGLFLREQSTNLPGNSEPLNLRLTHNDIERQRRNQMKLKFDYLKSCLPDIAKLERSPKILVLRCARDYIRWLQEEDRLLEKGKKSLKEKNQILLRKLIHLAKNVDKR